MSDLHPVRVQGNGIRLGQLLKLAGFVESGAQAKDVLGDGLVTVNGEVEGRRGRWLVSEDVVACGTERVRVEAAG